jgi:Na+/proline symporter
MIAYTFIAFLLIFLTIGLLSVKKKKEDLDDYYIASRSMSPLFVGLSGAATLLNGIMFFGNIGMTYMLGLKFSWFYIGAIIAHIVAFKYFADKFAHHGHKKDHATLLSFLTNNSHKNYKWFTIIAAIFIIIFSSVVASSQLLAGAKTLNYFFDIEYALGGGLVLLIVMLYCYAGGIRASIWTDVAQTIVMMIAMAILAFFALDKVGGINALIETLSKIDANLTNMFFMNNMGGWVTFGIGWFFMFIGTAIGSPQVAVRYLTIKNPEQTKKAGVYYTSYIAVFYLLAFIIGLCARAIIPVAALADKEFGLIMLASQLLPEFLIGVVLAGIFASIISTADSLVLVSSSSVVKDLFPKTQQYKYAKIFTIISCLLIYGIFIFGGKSVFSLLVMGYSATASVFFPLVILRLLNKKLDQKVAIFLMMIAVLIVAIWRSLGYYKIINECAIAIPIVFVVYALLRCINKKGK